MLDMGLIDLLMFSINPRTITATANSPSAVDERQALYRRCEAEGGHFGDEGVSGGQLLSAAACPLAALSDTSACSMRG